jgi:hypothetical protein
VVPAVVCHVRQKQLLHLHQQRVLQQHPVVHFPVSTKLLVRADIAVKPETVIMVSVVNKIPMFLLIHPQVLLQHTLTVHHQMPVSWQSHVQADRLAKQEIAIVTVRSVVDHQLQVPALQVAMLRTLKAIVVRQLVPVMEKPKVQSLVAHLQVWLNVNVLPLTITLFGLAKKLVLPV